MQNLTRAHHELFRRAPDECFGSLIDLWQHCQDEKERSVDHWHSPEAIKVEPAGGRLKLALGQDGSFNMNDWSFAQLCRLARVTKETVNRLSPETASQVFFETLPGEGKPLQALTLDQTVRAVHPASYTRLYDADLLTMVREFATDFQPPQRAGVRTPGEAVNDEDIPFEPDPEPAPPAGTGLYCGEQDMFCFLIDPAGWAEIGGEAFAPGFFVRLQQKDLRLIMAAADELGLPLPGASLVQQMFKILEAEGKGELGTQALLLAMEKIAGCQVAGAGAP